MSSKVVRVVEAAAAVTVAMASGKVVEAAVFVAVVVAVQGGVLKKSGLKKLQGTLGAQNNVFCNL